GIEAPANGQAQCRPSLRGFGQVKRDRPGGALHAIALDARRLAVVPILFPVALADNEMHVLGKLLRISVIKTPMPGMIAVTEPLGAAIGNPDVPELATVTHRLPL